MTNLLINEPPLQVLPSLAKVIGLNEAIILQQIHYWLDPRMNKNKREGVHWVYNSYEQWQEQFSFMSKRTIQRAVLSLEKQFLLITKKINQLHGDSTKWYTINYKNLSKIEASSPSAKLASGPNANLSSPSCQNGTTIYKETETTPKITNSSLNPSSLQTSGIEKKEGEKNINLKNKKGLKKNSNFLEVSVYSSSSQRVTTKEFERSPIAESMLKIWDDIVKEGQGTSYLQPKRQEKLLHALETYFDNKLENWEGFCKKIATSRFLMGETESKFSIKIDWVLKPETIEKMEEGSYTFGDREFAQPLTSIDYDKEEIKQIKSLESRLIEKIGQGTSKESDYKAILALRIKEGMEGSADYKLFKTCGWEKAGFNKVLEDYKHRMAARAIKHHKNPETLELFSRPKYEKAEHSSLKH